VIDASHFNICYSNQLSVIEAMLCKTSPIFRLLYADYNTDYFHLFHYVFVTLMNNEKLFAIVTDRSVFLPNYNITFFFCHPFLCSYNKFISLNMLFLCVIYYSL